MTAKFKNKQSKRVSTRKRTKIQRKVREHERKVKKEAKKNPSKKKKKDLGVPNSYPFKEQILQEAEKRKKEVEEERQKQRERQKKQRQKAMDKKRNLGDMLKDAQKRSADYDRKNAFIAEKSKDYTGGKAIESSLKAYYKEFRKVIESADVVLQVLDARDPLGSRCPQVEEAVLACGSNKRLVLLLNKIDLIPKENAEKWLEYLRKEYPTLPFKASTQDQTSNLCRSKVPLQRASEDLRQSSRCLGSDLLMKLLGNYCRSKAVKTSIRVGIVGFPNTGKSSVINSLKRSKACNTGATPGVTKAKQEVQLDKHIALIDSPGIVMATGLSETHTILRNCVRVETVEDPVPAVSAILKRCPKHQIMLKYNVADFCDASEFLSLLARRQGRLKKGGIPDAVLAGRTILQDWNNGKIRYYTHPPESNSMAAQLSAQIVTEMSKEFDIDALMSDEKSTLQALKPTGSEDFLVQSEGPTQGRVTDQMDVEDEQQQSDEDDGDENGEEEEMEEEVEEEELKSSVVMPIKPRSRTSSKVIDPKVKVDAAMKLSGNQQLNKQRKMQYKQMRKQKKKADKLAGSLSTALDDAMAGLGTDKTGEDYDFSVDFK